MKQKVLKNIIWGPQSHDWLGHLSLSAIVKKCLKNKYILRTETGGTNFLGDEFIVSYQEGSWIGLFNLPNFAKVIIVTHDDSERHYLKSRL